MGKVELKIVSLIFAESLEYTCNF